MKKILFILLFLPFVIKAQTLPVSVSGGSGNVNGTTFPLGTFSYNMLDTQRVKINVLAYGSVWGIQNYSAFTLSGVPFPSMDSLSRWFNRNLFATNFTKSQLDSMYLTMPVNIVTTDTLTVSKSGTYTFTGTTAKAWKMPTVSSATGMTIFVINRGTAALTINSNGGATDLDVNGVYSTNIIIAAGENYVLRGNSLKLVTVNN